MSDNAPSLKHPFQHRAEAALMRLMLGLLRGLGVDRASAVGAGIARCVGPLTRAHRVAAGNMAHALPEYDTAARARLLDGVWDNFGRTMFEYAHLQGLGDRITITGHDALRAHAGAGRPALLMAAHLGNWEITALAMKRYVQPVTLVYRPANNKLVDMVIADIRGNFTGALAPKGVSGARRAATTLKDGGLVLMLVDQRLSAGIDVPLFGRNATTAPAIASFALRFGCPIFPVRSERTAGANYKVTVEPPLILANTGDKEADIRAALVQINGRLESWVRAAPDQWLWMHRRWRN